MNRHPKHRPHPESANKKDTQRGIFKRTIARIPKVHILRLGHALGTCLHLLDRRHRRIVRRNIQFSQLRSSPEQIKLLSKRVFQHFGISLIEIMQMVCLNQNELVPKFHFKGQQVINDALAKQKGVVIVTAHLGNYEMAAQSFPCLLGLPMASVAKKLRNKRLNRFVHHMRTRFGNKVIYKKGALPVMMQTLRQGGIVTILMDVSRRFEGVEVNFFGRRATATPSAALLGLRCKSPVLPGFSYRNPRGKLVMEIEPPVEMQRSKNLRSDLQSNTQRITDRVERAILKNPEQWNWMLKRWKDFYPDLYPESAKRLEQIKRKEKRKRKSSPTMR